jgi:hypothetical protein
MVTVTITVDLAKNVFEIAVAGRAGTFHIGSACHARSSIAFGPRNRPVGSSWRRVLAPTSGPASSGPAASAQ